MPFRSFFLFVGTLFLTFLGLVFVTFMIGRVVPIDPVLAAVGDRAPADVYEQTRIEMGLAFAALAAVFHLCRRCVQGRPRQERADGAAGAFRYQAGVSGDAGAFDGGCADRAGGRHSFGGGGGCVSWAVAGSSGADCRAGGLFDAGVLAGVAGAVVVLREAGLGAGAGSAGYFLRGSGAGGDGGDFDRCGACGGLGGLGECASAI